MLREECKQKDPEQYDALQGAANTVSEMCCGQITMPSLRFLFNWIFGQFEDFCSLHGRCINES